MQRILSSQLCEHVGQTVRVAGWIHRRRLLKSVAFLILRDAAGLTQIVVSAEPARARLEALPEETTVAVTGTVTAAPSAPGGVEITEPVIEALTDPAEPPPFDLYRPELRANLATLLDHAPVALRHPRLAAAHRVGAAAVSGFRTALEAMSFVEIHTPKIVGTATESGANVFKLDYFGRPAYLAQSPQLYKQMMVGVFERVYEVGPVFRAEPSDTARHLASYTSLDAEMGFIDDHRDVIAACHATVGGMLAAIRESAGAELGLLGVTMPALPERPVVVHFTDVLEMISAA
ncbi:amino acid--tRNA ligase-related protein, partial [Acrocarpospora phusangensis]|uniref:amino acid--tRNA ligase-related protein n=1 Tax=Acrocarpospora phusangensis TaxID=1070424 RepID=UPI00195190F2